MDLHADGVYRFIMKNIRDEEKARDIVQEAFVRMWQKAVEIDFTKSKSYLFTTAYHTMIDMIRKDERMSRFEFQSQETSFSYNDFTDVKQVLDDALKTLPENQRTVILLRDYEGYAYAEIGEITGLSEAQVKVYIFRARTTLKNYIKRLDYVLEDR